MQRKVDVQKRNGFSRSFLSSGTATVGTLTPVLVKKVCPGEIVSDKISYNVSLPPMASNFRGRVDVCFESFFVPNRLLYGGWRNFLLYNGGLATQFAPAGVPKTAYPRMRYKNSSAGAGSLLDYLGYRPLLNADAANLNECDCLRVLAYHRIYHDWYRRKSVQSPVFLERSATSTASISASSLPWNYVSQSSGLVFLADSALNDGVLSSSLRQRNWDLDYFTDSFTTQNGGSSPVNVAVGEDGFSIQQFRVANGLQRFAERNQLADGDYKTTIFVNYGVTPSDALCEQSVFVRQIRKPIVTKSVFANQSNADATGSSAYGEYQGNRAGFSDSVDSGVLFDNFEIKEHGFVFVIMSLVPSANYAQGIPRECIVPDDTNTASFSDIFPIPQLAQVGNQPIYSGELIYSNTSPGPKYVFAYTERYAEYKTANNEVHGLLVSGQDMAYTMVQRTFPDSAVSLNSSFLQIPKTALDNITAVSALLSRFGYEYDVYHDFRVISPYPDFSTPTLCDHILDAKWVNVHSPSI